MDWLKPDTFSVNPWSTPRAPTEPYKPDFADDEGLKQEYGIALAKGLKPFDAGMELFNQELPKALWASIHWASDPVVIAAKDIYLQTLKKAQKPLDKEGLLAKLLELVDEKIVSNGHEVPLVEAKVRVDALKLYSEISGFTGRVNIDASTNFNNNTNNIMTIKLVRAEESASKLIEQAPNTKSKIQNEDIPSIPLKLVGGTSR
jgi:hypothetical protein